MKGGTALKKLYFGDDRFSEDLDFSCGDAPRGDALESALRTVATTASASLSVSGEFTVAVERVTHREARPGGQESFLLRIQFPWQRQPLCTVKIEVTSDEPVLVPTASRPILHGYGETLPGIVRVYALEEITADKLRATLQSEARRGQRAWIRPRCRDFYDLWRILGAYGESLDRAVVQRILPEKCATRSVPFTSAVDFFPIGLIALVTDGWEGDLGGLVLDLRPFERVLARLRLAIPLLLGQGPSERADRP